jgi:hypothetical protein
MTTPDPQAKPPDLPNPPYIVATVEMNPSISLEKFDAFLLNFRTFLSSYQHMIADAKFETVAPTTYTMPVLVNLNGITPEEAKTQITQALSSLPEQMTVTIQDLDFSNSAIPNPMPVPIVNAPTGQTSVVPIAPTTAGTESQRQGE